MAQSHAGSQHGGQFDIDMLYPRRPGESQWLLLCKACTLVSKGSQVSTSKFFGEGLKSLKVIFRLVTHQQEYSVGRGEALALILE